MSDTIDAVPTNDMEEVTHQHIARIARCLKGDNLDKFGLECLDLSERQVMNAAGLTQSSTEKIHFTGKILSLYIDYTDWK